MMDNGLRSATKNAISKYWNATIAKNNPASVNDSIISLSNGFRSSIIPIDPTTSNTTAILVISIKFKGFMFL